MWCINLSNLWAWVLWILVGTSFVGVIYLVIQTRYIEIIHDMWKKRIQENEDDIANLKVDVDSIKKHLKIRW